MIRAAGVTVIGPAHAEMGLPNQDALGLWGWRRGWIAAVCDGVGSRPLSHIGARLAATRVRSTIRSDISWDDPDAVIQSLHRSWVEGLKPLAPDEGATTLLMAACSASGNVFVAQLGDGIVLFSSNGQFGVLTPARTGFVNETTAFGLSTSDRDWHIARLQLSKPGDGVLLATDGISDDLRPERLEKFFRAMCKEMASRNRRTGRKWFHRQLEDWPTAGHCDDKTIAIVYRPN